VYLFSGLRDWINGKIIGRAVFAIFILAVSKLGV
jgi:hypothetical protein